MSLLSPAVSSHVSVSCALLQQPDFLFLDKASERRVDEGLRGRLPAITRSEREPAS